MKKSVVVVALLLTGLLFTQFAWLQSASGQRSTPDFAQKVNLALRRTAHFLLRETGDSTSRIPAVEQPAANTFQVRLDHAFNYERLPALLQQSLATHGIHETYDVAILECSKGALVLGYTVQDANQPREIPCSGRDREKGCYTLRISFRPPVLNRPPIANGWALLAGVILLGGAFLMWNQSSRAPKTELLPNKSRKAQPPVRVGQVLFDPAIQSVHVAGLAHSLTYREAKLLHLFVRYPNQVLERDFILKSVWEDEGIIVGRSVDVFVSRLRKLLQADPSVHLVAVHGVGYRLDVQE